MGSIVDKKGFMGSSRSRLAAIKAR